MKKVAKLSVLLVIVAIYCLPSLAQSKTSLLPTNQQCPQTLIKKGVCVNPGSGQSNYPLPPLQVTQVVGSPNRGGSNPDPKLLVQLGDWGRGEKLPLVFASLSCNDPYMEAYSYGNQLNQQFQPFVQLQNIYGNTAISQQIFEFQSTPDNYLDGWNIFSAMWYQVGWFCDDVVVVVNGQSQSNPVLDTKAAKCAANHAATCTTPDLSIPDATSALVLAIGVATGPNGDPTQGFVSPGEGCSISGGEISPLGTIVEVCAGNNASANFGPAGGVGILTAIAVH